MKIYDLHMIHIVYSRQGILWIKLSIYISYVVSLSAPLLFGGLFLNLMFGGGRTLGNWIAAVFNGNNPEGRFAGFRNL